jgi:hypothetical protein
MCIKIGKKYRPDCPDHATNLRYRLDSNFVSEMRTPCT